MTEQGTLKLGFEGWVRLHQNGKGDSTPKEMA